ncbi:MAG: pyruvate dehydrogenase (acetyl-transferring) E1 component subunit alpha [Verrucomicrobiota bacterium]|nr:pyruvate dehydrogenase (acetyl-transferring) E1 component subunit alpha [Verrucomicrobiota bacterium]
MKAEGKIRLYTTMVRIRRFEERAVRAYQQGKIGGFLHDYIGQESIAVGCCSLMKEHDHVITAYRDHGHAIAVGMNQNALMAELYGKVTGCSKGKGGSMHYFAPDKNYWGGHGIVAGQTPLGTGLAYALKYKGLKGCCMCFMGDGAVNQGVFHESLNLAQLWKLPVIYVIENNGYSMGTSLARSSAFSDSLAMRAEGYNMAWDTGNGHLIYEVRAKVAAAIERAHEHSLPTLLELKTYRYRGHSIADANAEKYRTKDEIRRTRETKDPISIFKTILLEEKVLTEDIAKDIEKSARDEANNAADYADRSPYPPVEDITNDVYWSVDNPGKHDNHGKIFFND